MRNFRGTCPSVEMLKDYMVKERLGTPVLGYDRIKYGFGMLKSHAK